MPSVSVALAEMVIEDETVAPLAGAVTFTVGPLELAGVVAMDFGDRAEIFPAASYAATV